MAQVGVRCRYTTRVTVASEPARGRWQVVDQQCLKTVPHVTEHVFMKDWFMHSGELRCWYSVANRDTFLGAVVLSACSREKHPADPKNHHMVTLTQDEKAQWHRALNEYREYKKGAMVDSRATMLEGVRQDAIRVAREQIAREEAARPRYTEKWIIEERERQAREREEMFRDEVHRAMEEGRLPPGMVAGPIPSMAGPPSIMVPGDLLMSSDMNKYTSSGGVVTPGRISTVKLSSQGDARPASIVEKPEPSKPKVKTPEELAEERRAKRRQILKEASR